MFFQQVIYIFLFNFAFNKTYYTVNYQNLFLLGMKIIKTTLL